MRFDISAQKIGNFHYDKTGKGNFPDFQYYMKGKGKLQKIKNFRR
jgi:hypothetical protein